MSAKILHILNGDATLDRFNKTNIQGKCAVMRETFCFWPQGKFQDQAFWETRRQFFKKNYDCSPQEYDQRVLGEFEKVKGDWDEVCIWYEYDVYCQLNMLFSVSWANYQTKAKLSLVYSEIGLGKEDHAKYGELFEQRKQLSTEEIKTLESLWNKVVHKDLKHLIPEDLSGFPNLFPSLVAYQKQFIENGAKPIQQRIIQFLKDGEAKTGKEIVKHLLRTDEIYGFGDLQYLIILDSMEADLDFPEIPKDKKYFDRMFEVQFSVK